MNNSCYLTTTFCRKCKKLKSCLDTRGISNYRYMCKECAKEEDLVSECVECGREGITAELIKRGNYCHLCESNNIIECKLCGKEVYKSNTQEGICKLCAAGDNKECTKCGGYFPKDKLTKDNLCNKCSIKIHKKLIKSGVDEIVECVECGRETLVNDTKDGLCIYCKCEGLETQIKKLKKRKKAYY